MSSVTQRIKEITQPRGGYIKVSDFEVVELQDNSVLNKEENIHSSVIGMVVDYMTRLSMGTDVKDAFRISIMGAFVAEKLGDKDAIKKIDLYIDKIKGLDDKSIINACKAVTYDVWYRNTPAAAMAKTAKDTNPDELTIENIRIMINRSINFWNTYGPIKVDGFTFENGGYTNIVDSGDGDFLTDDTLWDFKVSKAEPQSAHTLQLLMYYIMGKHSNQDIFNNINKIGIFNPRLNKAYIKKVDEIPQDVIDEVSLNVIGYTDKDIQQQKVLNMDKRLEMPEIMKVLGCTRYMVMKMYAEKELPLQKKKNKYYITEMDLINWIEEQKELQKQQMITRIILVIVVMLVLIIMFTKILK